MLVCTTRARFMSSGTLRDQQDFQAFENQRFDSEAYIPKMLVSSSLGIQMFLGWFYFFPIFFLVVCLLLQ